ncbi:hypothetical protein [Muricoccus pecuniae]|uniref:Uncharacterized protein n=1 Tax=Muricoccus pecuniae TaxID=693023 RepID=A0A840YJC5_9PROT|nr:hypothetical protein [Roseomonas pecuniae]MBB5694253.1 hypothetical protein [Roseomonas pecuniae]
MSAQTERHLSRYAVEDARPVTFLERGVTVPFTTPILLGSRVRPGQRRGLELSVPSPGGVRGFYVMPLRALDAICNPTLHDRLVTEMIEELPVITPDDILRIARAVAHEGLVGRAAAAAAGAAEKALANQRLLTNYRLLMLLIRQTEAPGEHAVPPEGDAPASVKRRGERAVMRVSQRTGLPLADVISALDGLTEAFISVGLRGNPTAARHQNELDELERLAADVSGWAESVMDAQQAGSAGLIARCARLTLDAGRIVTDRLFPLTDDLSALMQRWSANSQAIREEAARLAWLLDGWSVILSIWKHAEVVGRAAAIREMAVIVPTMPIEISRWTGSTAEEEIHASTHRMRSRFVFRLEDWRTGRTLEVIARNEMLVREFI